MTIYDNLFNETKARFEGKRVLKVDPDYKFWMDDGTCFYLDYSREAGLFTNDAPGSDGLCKSLTTWFDEYYKHAYHLECDATTVPRATRSDSDTITILTLIANDDECFNLDVSALSEKEREFVNSTDLNDLAQLAPMGDCWACGVKEDTNGNLVMKDEWKNQGNAGDEQP